MTRFPLRYTWLRRLGRLDWIAFGLRDRIVRRLAGPDTVFLDIGANVGHHSLFMAAHARQVHAFEPWTVAADAIRRKIALNGTANITAHPVGLSDHAHDAVYYAPTLANQGTGSFVAGHSHGNQAAGPLPLVQGDAYLAERAITGISVIKIDAEGFEPMILKGLSRTLCRDRPVVVFEMSASSGRTLEGEKDVAARLLALFSEDWELRILGGGADRYRLEPFRPAFDGHDIVAIPRELVSKLPAAGRL
ncbi:FkbM family methyltransferase [Magnetospirillum sp. 15-1]|uniref:FkbM family methyltransferase n=1 Tax=Magnetospirillum sp. 15-1 TaxID=1979370 RepID=UPI00148203A1|nr:FkbM family methyltransferase [Magnetospirillum sp. 15-1]